MVNIVNSTNPAANWNNQNEIYIYIKNMFTDKLCDS